MAVARQTEGLGGETRTHIVDGKMSLVSGATRMRVDVEGSLHQCSVRMRA